MCRGLLLAAGAHHLDDFFSLRFAELSVDQDGFTLTTDQYRRHLENGLVAGIEMGQRKVGARGVNRGDQHGERGGLQQAAQGSKKGHGGLSDEKGVKVPV